MAQLIVRNLEDDVRDKLRARAESHGRSMEEEVRDILRGAVISQPNRTEPGLGTRIAKRFADLNLDPGDFEIPEWRGSPARPAAFDE